MEQQETKQTCCPLAITRRQASPIGENGEILAEPGEKTFEWTRHEH